MAITYEPIATTTLGSDITSVTFSSIPATYTDLVLICTEIQSDVAGSSFNDGRFRFNGDTGSNYSQTRLRGDGSSATSARDSNEDILYTGMIAQASSPKTMMILQIMNYSNTTTYKTVLCRAGAAGLATQAHVGLWRSTAAINEVAAVYPSQVYKAGCTFTLYGIASA